MKTKLAWAGWVVGMLGSSIPVWAENWNLLDRRPTSYEASESIHNSNVALDRPNALSLEIMGRGLLYSVDYDRSISYQVALGIGISIFSLNSSLNEASGSIRMIPIYSNFYFSP